MHDFILKEINSENVLSELNAIGFDNCYIDKAVNKFYYKNIKIYNLTISQAIILKQVALSSGADCATHRETITFKVKNTDCILGGSYSQLENIAQKLEKQPFGLKELAKKISEQLVHNQNKTKIVGILNLTKDSFSDGFYDYDSAITHLETLSGADIIDIGAESTRPGFEPVLPCDQIKKLIPVIEYIDNSKIISIDTRSHEVAEECLKKGVNIINDISGFSDEQMPYIVAKYDAKIVIGHDEKNDNTCDEIYLSLKKKIDIAISAGIKKENIIIDIGIGFSKTRERNFELLKRIDELKSLGYPVMAGISRKSLLNIPDSDNFTKDIYTLALNAILINKKVDYIRVHNVELHKNFLQMISI